MENYRKEVRKFYEELRDQGNLSSNLLYPTCAKIRDECLILFKMGASSNDLRTLKEFMGLNYREVLLERTIMSYEPDKFKPLVFYLTRKGYNTGFKYIELLAWLIGFQTRPYPIYRASKGGFSELSSVYLNPIPYVEDNKVLLADNKPEARSSDQENNIEILQYFEQDVYKHKQQYIQLEYPNGIKVTVDSNNFDLIRNLIHLIK